MRGWPCVSHSPLQWLLVLLPLLLLLLPLLRRPWQLLAQPLLLPLL